jgi:hypothetical protein
LHLLAVGFVHCNAGERRGAAKIDFQTGLLSPRVGGPTRVRIAVDRLVRGVLRNALINV